MQRSSLPLSLGKLKQYWEAGTLKCTLPFQRHAGMWNNITKSNLVWSMLSDGYIPPIVLLKDKTGVDSKGKDTFDYEILDGQQRLTTLFAYMNDEWSCHASTDVVELDGFEYDIAGYKYSELPEELQDAIKGYRFGSIQMLENYDYEEIEKLYFNINSGVALSTIQKSKSKLGTELISYLNGLLDEDFFTQGINITEAQARREDDLCLLLQIMLLIDNMAEGLEYKNISQATCLSYAESIRGLYHDEKRNVLSDLVGYLSNAFQSREKYLRKNNVPIVALNALVANEVGKTPEEFKGFVDEFFNNIYPAYEEASGSGNVKAHKVQQRLKVMFEAMCVYFDLDAYTVPKPFSFEVVSNEEVGANESAED